jgi:outer membrane protein insertion porin family
VIRPALLLLALVAPAAAQPADVGLAPTKFDPALCDQPKPAPASPDGAMTAPVSASYADFELAGTFVDPAATVHALIAPTMKRNRSLDNTARTDIARSLRAFGYELVGLGTRETPNGTHAILHLAPMPLVRRITVDVSQSLFSQLLDDEIRRRMSVRTGAYLPWNPLERGCRLHEETGNIEKFLRDEGYFEARASIDQRMEGAALILRVNVSLGPAYTVDVDRIQIADAAGLALDAGEIRAKFRHRGTCLLGPYLCLGKPRFSRTQLQGDIAQVVDLFHARGYPAVRVRSDFDPGMSVDRRTKTVRFGLTIDQRRRLDVQFEGYNPASVSLEQLKKQLTFDRASSTDEVEAAQSARAIAEYLQSRGYYDVRVTWNRERFNVFDRLIYRIDQGATRTVRTVGFTGNRAFSYAELADAVAIKPARLSTSLFGGSTAATSLLLSADVDRIAALYRRKGYLRARVRVAAGPDPAALDSAALTAGFLLANRGGGLHVRFMIDEGPPTLLRQLRVELGDKGDAITTPEEAELCRLVLAQLAELHGYPGFATPAGQSRCVADATGLLFREGDVAETRDRLRDRMFSLGRPRTVVDFDTVQLGPTEIAARYRLRHAQELQIGKLVLRGNFRTRGWIIRRELKLREGAPLTSDALADGARRLRNTGMFDAVNISLLDLEQTSAGAVNATVEVTERYGRAQVELESGYSSFNGAFVKVLPSFKNLFGIGMSLDLTGTLGFELGILVENRELQLRQLAAEATLRIPPWLLGPLGFQAELTAFHRRQDTPRFGLLRTTGATAALSRTWERQRLGSRPARAITTGFHYDFRSRERNVDAVRPIGADDDESQVPITTLTGSVGATFEWEQRVDRRGTLSPLAPEAGFRFDGQVSFASRYLLGQDDFIKVSAAGSKYWPLGANLVLRADLRFDQGFPLGGAALLPEVERFFAGGDATVRGYEDERLATEVIRVGVPPLSGVEQIRILPAGGNIRALGSLDAQLRIYKIVASAVFVDAGMIANQWGTVTPDDIRPSAGIALFRVVTAFGVAAVERAVPLRPRLGDDPRGRWHLSFAARAQF